MDVMILDCFPTYLELLDEEVKTLLKQMNSKLLFYSIFN